MSKKGEMSFDVSSASKDLLKRFGIPGVMGVGSGSTVAQFVKTLAVESNRRRTSPTCIPSSIQIQQVMLRFKLTVGDSSLVSGVELMVDGADQVDRHLNMIKGGGGALLKEKILHRATKRLVIMVAEKKMSRILGIPVPVEVLPFAQNLVEEQLRKMRGKPKLRLLEKGYPFITDNGNIILDTDFGHVEDPPELEREVKGVPGVIEVGVFTRRPDAVYVLREDGSFRVLT